jgi:predicted molibdopterin-dependent oxidoreductase YjgC
VASEVEKGLNVGNLCVKGRFGIGYVNSSDRLTTPLVRNAAGELEQTSWEEALARVVERALAVRRDKGGAAMAAVCGTHSTNETAYLLQKLVRTVFASNNIDSIDHGWQAASEEALAPVLGASSATNSRLDLAEADVILVLGANLTESDPVLALQVIKALRSGKTVIVVDPRTTELARRAELHLAIRPGTDLALLRGMLRHLLDLGLQDEDFVAEHTEGFSALKASLEGIDVAAEAETCGLDVKVLQAAAEAYGRAAAAAILYGPGLTQGPKGTESAKAAVYLALLTGNLGRPGTGIYPLRSGANSQGLFDMGVRPDRLPGGSPLTDPETRAKLEAVWGSALPEGTTGYTLGEILGAAEAHEIDFLYVVGADPALSAADESRTRKALESVDFLVVQDSFLTDTASYADVVLPSVVSSEDEGTFTNVERFVQRVRRAVPTLGDALPDWEIIQRLANASGADWAYADPADVMREVADAVWSYNGISYERIGVQGIQSPCPSADHEGTPILYADGFGQRKAVFAAVDSGVAETAIDADYPFALLTGCVLEHHGTGVRSRRSSGLTELMEEARLEINPADADRLGVSNGDRVRVLARDKGAIELAAWVTGRVLAGTVFAPGFSATAPVSRLLERGPAACPAVRVERV